VTLELIRAARHARTGGTGGARRDARRR